MLFLGCFVLKIQNVTMHKMLKEKGEGSLFPLKHTNNHRLAAEINCQTDIVLTVAGDDL